MTWEPCYAAPTEVHAHLVKGYLEQYGVPCLLDNRRFGMKPVSFGALGEVYVLVRAEWLPVARALLARRRRPRRSHLRVIRGGLP